MTAAHLPVWPLAILFLLLSLGHRLSRTRMVRPRTTTHVALALLVFSLHGVVAGFGAQALPLLAWAGGMAGALLLGGPLFTPRGLLRQGDAVLVPGSWLPLGLLLGIFATKFALGWAHAVGSPLVHQAWVIACAAALLGLISGAFATRAWAVRRVVNSVPQDQPLGGVATA